MIEKDETSEELVLHHATLVSTLEPSSLPRHSPFVVDLKLCQKLATEVNIVTLTIKSFPDYHQSFRNR